MAEKIKGITIDIGGNTSGLDNALKGVNKEISTTQTELSKVEKLLKLDPSNTTILAQKQELLSKAINDTTSKIDTLKQAKEQADVAMKNGAEVNQEGYRALEREIANAEQKLSQLKTQAEGSGKSITELGDETKSAGNKAKESANGGFTIFKGVVANLATDVVRGAINGLKSLGSALINVGKQAISGYADFEQLKGGVETLFGESAGTVQKYAENAYKTAGLSANKYMETVTSFSASLLQSLNGDTEKSAKVADMAITDMSDNANKMGTSMEMIQNAYQGFAKQNYTMLDNLKLGYGGTKTEMERLLADAEKFSGQKYDISNLNDVYQAIHVVQTEMGITGTTAKEASMTISGSVNAMKGSWNNLLSGMTDNNADIEMLINNLVDSVFTVIDNIVPRLMSLSDRFPTILTNIITKINENLPQLLQVGITIIQSLVNGINQNMPMIMNAVTQIILMLTTTLISMLPKILEMGITILTELIKGIAEALPELIPAMVDAMLLIVDTLIDNIDMLVECALVLMIALAEGLIEALPNLIEKAPEIIIKLVKAILKNMPKLLDVGIQLIQELWKGAVSVWRTILTNIGQVIWDNVLTPIENKVSDFMDVGKNLIEGLWNGIKNTKDWLIDKIQSLCSDALSAIKNFFGIESPSKVMRDQVGVFLAQGLGIGIEKGTDFVLNKADILNTKILDKEKELSSKLEEVGLDEELEKSLKAQLEIVKTFRSEYQKAMEDIEKSQDTLQNKMESISKLFTYIKTEDSGDILQLGDIQSDIDKIKEYGTALNDIKSKNIDESLMKEILDLDIDDATKYIETLLSMTNEDYDEYMALWDEKQKLAEEIARGFYKSEFDSLQNEFVDKLPTELDGIKGEMQELGKLSAQGLGNGFSSQFEYIKNQMVSTLQRAYASAQEAMDVHSPSKLFAKLGTFMAEGIAVGFGSETKNVIKTIEDSLNKVSKLLDVNMRIEDVNIKGHSLVSQNQNVTRNYTQRTEIVRQPSEVDMYIDGNKIGRAIVPALDREYTRLGVNLA